MKRSIFIILVGLVMLANSTNAQNYIDMTKEQVVENMRKVKLDFMQSKVINQSYNYLKFQDPLGEQTILYFLNDDNICTMVKLMSHYVYLGQEIADLNQKYIADGDNKWKYNENGKNYAVELQKGQWFFSIIIKKIE